MLNAMPPTRDWGAMRDLSERVLEERTGVSLAAWNRRVKERAPQDEAALRAWLEGQGVTGYGQSLLVWERFGYPDFLTASAAELIDAQYADRPKLRPTFDRLIDLAAGLGEVTVQARKTYVSLVAPERTFARIRAKKDAVELGLRLDVKPRGRLKPSNIHGSTPVQIELAAPDEVDDDVMRWLQRAYDESA